MTETTKFRPTTRPTTARTAAARRAETVTVRWHDGNSYLTVPAGVWVVEENSQLLGWNRSIEGAARTARMFRRTFRTAR